MKNQLRKTGAIVLLIFFISLSAPAMAGSQWETKEINFENESVVTGAVSGDYIIFLTSEGMTQSDNRIRLYDIGSGDTNIIGIPSEGMTVTGGDISGNSAVWFETEAMDNFEENDSETKPNTIYLMNIEENSTTILDLPEDAEWPKINGNEIFWSNSSEDSFETEFYVYDIATKESKLIMTADCFDPAGIEFSDGNIAYEDQKALHLYNIESGKDTVVYAYKSDNESGSNIDSFDMSGDYIIYITHSVISGGDDKGVYYEPVLYTISANKTESLNPKSGEVSGSVALADQKTQLFSPFTDASRLGWSYQDTDSESKIILFDPATGNASAITAAGSVNDVCLDGNRMIWTVSHFPSFHSSLVYAEETVPDENGASQSAPGFSFFTVSGAMLISIYLIGRKKF